MEFTPLNLLNSFLTGRNAYSKTPNLLSMSKIMTGRPEFLNPDEWDAYNIYLTTPQLYAVIQRRGYLLASGVWKHYRTERDGRVVEVENSEVVKILENPNPLMKGNDLIRQWNENKCIYGNNYELLMRALPSLPIAGFNNLPPAQMQIETTGKIYRQTKMEDIIVRYKLMQLGEVADTFEPWEINHTRVVNGKNAVKGESPMIPIFMPISNIRAAYGFRNVIMTKKGALGILSNNSKDSAGAIPLNDTERKRLEAEYHRLYGNGEDQMQVLMTNTSLSWSPMTYPTKDLMLFEEISDDFRTIIDQYGLNDNLFSKSDGSTFENMAWGLKQAYQSTIIPEAEELAMNRSQLFGLAEKGEWLELDYSHIPVLQENEKEKAETHKAKVDAWTIMLNDGIVTPQQYADEFHITIEEQDPAIAQQQSLQQAQTNLRGTVGGLDGIISLNNAVSTGQMDRTTAVNTLVNYYGYEQSVAESMITTPPAI